MSVISQRFQVGLNGIQYAVETGWFDKLLTHLSCPVSGLGRDPFVGGFIKKLVKPVIVAFLPTFTIRFLSNLV